MANFSLLFTADFQLTPTPISNEKIDNKTIAEIKTALIALISEVIDTDQRQMFEEQMKEKAKGKKKVLVSFYEIVEDYVNLQHDVNTLRVAEDEDDEDDQ